MQKQLERKINKSAKRTAKATGIFAKIEQQLTTEAQFQREMYDTLEAERQAAADQYLSQIEALTNAHEQYNDKLIALQDEARSHGENAQAGAQKIRELFI